MRQFLIDLTKPLLAVAALLVMPALVSAQSPYLQPDESWISIDGTVETVTANAFVLDYGQGHITVEMDDGDRDADGYKLLTGDRVVVAGRIDADFFETASIEAATVYVENAGTFFTASSIDEEDTYLTVTTPFDDAGMTLLGTVTEVRDDEFVVNSGLREIAVETSDMPYDPLDDTGYQKIQVGDYVSVSGEVEYDLLEGRTLLAETVSTISTP